MNNKTEEFSLSVTVGDGKYTVHQLPDGRLEALRYGQPWRDCCGDNLIYALAVRVIELEERVKSLQEFLDHADAVIAEEKGINR